MSDYPNVRDCQHGQLRRSCERCADAAEIAALRARLAEVEAERDEVEQALRRLREWDMLTLTDDGHGAATQDAPWAVALIDRCLAVLDKGEQG